MNLLNGIGMRLTMLVAVAIALPVRAQAGGGIEACVQPVLAPGQEAAIEKMVTPAQLPSGAQRGDIQVQRDRILALFTAADGTRIDYELTAIHGEVVAMAQKTGRFHLRRAAPCANPAEPCALAADLLKAMDAAVLQAVLAGEAAVQWRCQEVTVTPTGLGAALRGVDGHMAIANTAAANQALDAALRDFPPDRQPVAMRLDLGLALWKVGRKPEATRVLDAALGLFDIERDLQPPPLSPTQVALAERVAAAHALRGRADTGARLLATCTERAGGTRCSAIPLADALELAGDPSAAAVALDAQLQQAGATVTLFHARLGLASRSNDAAAELRTATAAAAMFPGDLAVKEALAMAQFRSRHHAAAIATLEQILKQDSQRPNMLGRISGIYHDMGSANGGQPTPDRESFRDGMRARLVADPNDLVALFLSGIEAFYSSQFERAITILGRVEVMAPKEARIYIYQAMANLWLGRDVEAERLVRKAMVTNPNDPDVYYCLSQVTRKRDIPLAITALERYVALSSAPGAMEFAGKTKRVRQELQILRSGKLPPLWDRPGHFADEIDTPAAESSIDWRLPVAIGLGGLGVAGGVWALLRRRRRRRLG